MGVCSLALAQVVNTKRRPLVPWCGQLLPWTPTWMVWICWLTADSTSSSRRLNSSKQPQAPHLTRPTKMRPMDLKSNSSSQLNTSTCRASACPSALTDSVLPVPAGPYGLPP